MAITTHVRGRGARRIAGMSALGALGALGIAPVAAQAATSPGPVPPVSDGATPGGHVSTSAVRHVQPLIANYGFQKIRVGIEVKPGAVVAPGTSLAGATIQIVTSAASAQSFESPGGTFTCTTGVDGFCDVAFPGYGGVQDTLIPTQNAQISQLTAPTGLTKDSAVQTVQPCESTGLYCGSSEQVTTTDVVLQDAGPAPIAVPKTAQVIAGNGVTVAIESTDGNGAPILSVSATRPAHGTVTTSTTGLTYHADGDFSGTDHFSYTVTTANGSATAAVTVTVTAAATSSPASSTSPTSSTPTATASSVDTTTASTPSSSSSSAGAALANTGASDAVPLTWGGAGLVGLGSVVLYAGRRRFATAARRQH